MTKNQYQCFLRKPRIIFHVKVVVDYHYGLPQTGRDLMSMLNLDVAGYISKISYWNILKLPLGNSMAEILPNWSGGGISKFSGMRYPLDAQYVTKFPMDG